MMREYKLSGKAPLQGILITLILGLLGAAMMGTIVYFFYHYLYFYLPFLGHVVAAYVVSAFARQGIFVGKIRNSVLVFTIGLLCGGLVIPIYYAHHYQAFRANFQNAVLYGKIKNSQYDPQIAEDTLLKGQSGQTGFIGFMIYAAKKGIVLSENYQKNNYYDSRRIRDYNALFIWILEIGFIGLATGVLSSNLNDQPFDELSNSWYKSPVHVLSAHHEQAQLIGQLLRDQRYTEAGQLMTRETLEIPKLTLSARSTRDKNTENIILDLHSFTHDKKKKTSKQLLVRGIVSQSELEDIMEAAKIESPMIDTSETTSRIG
jgi:hypothetical protein